MCGLRPCTITSTVSTTQQLRTYTSALVCKGERMQLAERFQYLLANSGAARHLRMLLGSMRWLASWAVKPG